MARKKLRNEIAFLLFTTEATNYNPNKSHELTLSYPLLKAESQAYLLNYLTNHQDIFDKTATQQYIGRDEDEVLFVDQNKKF